MNAMQRKRVSDVLASSRAPGFFAGFMLALDIMDALAEAVDLIESKPTLTEIVDAAPKKFKGN